MMNTILIILVVAIMVWIIGTILAIRGIEEPRYTVVSERERYEIRDYASYIVAEVEVD